MFSLAAGSGVLGSGEDLRSGLVPFNSGGEDFVGVVAGVTSGVGDFGGVACELLSLAMAGSVSFLGDRSSAAKHTLSV